MDACARHVQYVVQEATVWTIVASSLGFPFVFAGYAWMLARTTGHPIRLFRQGNQGNRYMWNTQLSVYENYLGACDDLSFQCMMLGPLGIPLSIMYMLAITFAFLEYVARMLIN